MILGIGGAGCHLVNAIKRNASSDFLRDASFAFTDTDLRKLYKFEEAYILNISDIAAMRV